MTERARFSQVLEIEVELFDPRSLRELDIAELTGHNLEARGRKEVNRLLQAGWRLFHTYTLTYKDDGIQRHRPMAILGRPRAALRFPWKRR